MKISDLEKRLQQHAKITKSVIAAPFELKREEINMEKRRKHNIKRAVLLAAAIICLIGTTAFAAYHLLGAKDVANTLGNAKLAQFFSERGTISETVTDGDYKATVLGIASGKNLSNYVSSTDEVFHDKTYAVVAVEKTDGTAMTYDDQILVSPLIEGLNPWQYNIFTMNGGYSADIIDGVLYRIIEMDNIEYFADKNVYMAVVSDMFLDNTSFSFDEKTGKISPKRNYDGTNILIPLALDKSKADPKKAATYLKKLEENSEISKDEEIEPGVESENVKEIIITKEMVDAATKGKK